jgi:GT2 family glycosyltransferase
VIVNWHSREDLKRCIASVFQQTRSIDPEIVVIDCASFDGCEAMLGEHYPQVRFIQSLDNVGFAKANNRAFMESSGDCVLFLNPDTEVIGAAVDTLFAMVNSLPDCGTVGGKLLNSDGTIQSSSIQATPTILNKVLDSDFLRNRWRGSSLWGATALYDGTSDAREVEVISGACVMMKRDVFEKVGRFSEDYFMYAEDVDLSHKTRAAGYRNYYVPSATVIHHGGSSSAQSVSTFAAVMMPEATRRFFRKTRGNGYAQSYRLCMCLAALGRLLLLTLAAPIWARAERRTAWSASLRKWQAMFWWSLGRHELVRRYYIAWPDPGC